MSVQQQPVESFEELLNEFASRTFTNKIFVQHLLEQDVNNYELQNNTKMTVENRKAFKLTRLASMVSLYRQIGSQVKEKVFQAVIIRGDRGLDRGKIASYTAHASVLALPKADINYLSTWYDLGTPKRVYEYSSSLDSLEKYFVTNNIPHYSVVDPKNPQSAICIAVGPVTESTIKNITDKLKKLV